MAWNYYWDGVGTIGRTNGPSCRRRTQLLRKGAVRDGSSRGNLAQQAPHSLLEARAGRRRRQRFDCAYVAAKVRTDCGTHTQRISSTVDWDRPHASQERAQQAIG
jgi:hypothetical protein